MPGELERILADLYRPIPSQNQRSNIVLANGAETVNQSVLVPTAGFGDQDSEMCLGLTCNLLEHLQTPSPSGETLTVDTIALGLGGVMPV